MLICNKKFAAEKCINGQMKKNRTKLQEIVYKEGGGDYILTRQFPRGLSGAGVVWWSSVHLTVN